MKFLSIRPTHNGEIKQVAREELTVKEFTLKSALKQSGINFLNTKFWDSDTGTVQRYGNLNAGQG